MHYVIEVHYQTGDSFHTEEKTEIVEMIWHNLSQAEESLDRLKNHYKYYEKNDCAWQKPKGKMPNGVSWNNKYKYIQLEFVDDEGEPVLYSPSWCGYFETLYSAEIKAIGKRYEFN